MSNALTATLKEVPEGLRDQRALVEPNEIRSAETGKVIEHAVPADTSRSYAWIGLDSNTVCSIRE
jgi:hypothetical protein